MPDTTANMIEAWKLGSGLREVHAALEAWIARADAEIQEDLRWQFIGGSNYLRSIVVFACHIAASERPIGDPVICRAQVVEMLHNGFLILNDLVNEWTQRRGKPTLHRKFGTLRALMVSGYIVADCYEMLTQQPYYTQADLQFDLRLFSELIKRLGVAECVQSRRQRSPLGLADWHSVAERDTGTMFEICACLGARANSFRPFGRLLGVLYHGCDDVRDIKRTTLPNGEVSEDIQDRALTLPAALAIRSPDISRVFLKKRVSDKERQTLFDACIRQLPSAERYLDAIADEAKRAAQRFSRLAEPLCALVEYTRRLSSANPS